MNDKQIAIKLSDDNIKELDKYAQMVGKTRHQLIKDILEVAVEEIETLKSVGIFQLGILVRDLQETFKRKIGITTKVKDENEGKPIPVKLSESFILRLDTLATKGDISRHQLMKNFIKVGLEELKSMEKLKIIKMANVIRDLHAGFKKICDTGTKAFKATE